VELGRWTLARCVGRLHAPLVAYPPRPTAAGIYHLAVRSATPDLLFRDGADCLSLIAQLDRVTADTEWTVIAVCLMGTHYHVMVDAGEGVLAGAMKRINWAYAVNHNKRHGRRGHRVGCKYLSVAISTDEQLLACYRYIVHNPVEKGLCRQPDDWPWSSYAAAIDQSSAFSFVDASIVLEMFDHDHDIAVQQLRGFVEPRLAEYERALPDGAWSQVGEPVSDT
jgi:putative transposase